VEVEEVDVLVLVNSTMLAAGQVCRGSTGWLVGVEARNKMPWVRRGKRQAKRSDRLRVVLVARIVKKRCRRSISVYDVSIGDVI
jgi:hypothetical protein